MRPNDGKLRDGRPEGDRWGGSEPLARRDLTPVPVPEAGSEGSRILLGGLWQAPDPQLMAAGRGGELLVARVRLVLLGLLLTIPLVQLLAVGDLEEAGLGLALIVAAFPVAVVIHSLARRRRGYPWLGFFSSLLDVSLVSAELVLFVLLGQPHLAVNSRLLYPIYFLALGATALRYDPRICLVTGTVATGEYLGVVLLARYWAIPRADSMDLLEYGGFAWVDQYGRLLLLGAAALLSTLAVVRSRRLLEVASRDALTGLYNRDLFDQRLDEELHRADRADEPLAVAILDLDDFKAVNDSHGHAVGDRLLRELSAELTARIRRGDVVSRYGGEEFALLFPGLGREVAGKRLEAIREAVESFRLELGDDREVSVSTSIGLAVYPADGKESSRLLREADRRLYEAKRRGKNRVVGGNGT
ncbi:MAG: GGDEF domain-containing protein [Thermoanaerobaculia bacterium]|nr:GGDEF domain-containing protein [Thermoanaerobaculia bacterium]